MPISGRSKSLITSSEPVNTSAMQDSHPVLSGDPNKWLGYHCFSAGRGLCAWGVINLHLGVYPRELLVTVCSAALGMEFFGLCQLRVLFMQLQGESTITE